MVGKQMKLGQMKLGALPSHRLAAAFVVTLLFVVLAALPAQAGFKFVSADGMGGTSSAAPTTPVVEGFGDRVPLPVALRQILPRGTIYNIAPDVDMGVQVSWKGGRAWQSVLNDMLTQVGLQATIASNTVTVRRAAFLNGNVTGTSEPIQLMPPVKLTPPVSPVVIGDDLPAPRPAAKLMPPQSAVPANAPANRPAMDVVGEVTSLDADAMPAPAASASMPVTRDLAAAPATREVTSLDAEFKDGAPTQMGSPPGFLTVPAGIDATTDGSVTFDNANGSTLAPLDGSAPMIIGESQLADPNVWEARAGQSLREVLSSWAERSNIELNWQSEYDYPVQASLNYNGTFEEAVRTLLYGFKDATPQPIGRLHKNEQIGQQALLITTRGNIYEE